MPLIDFPRIPEVPGVPDLRRAQVGILVRTGIQGKIDGLDKWGLIDLLMGPQWKIVSYKTGETVIDPDSVVSFEYKTGTRIATYPMEKGSFSAYNKVQTPYDIRMRMTCNGNGKMTRQQFLQRLDAMIASVEVVQIVTPDVSYNRVNLERYDFKREARDGVTLLTVEAMFTEIRDNAEVVYGPVKEPAAADPASMSCLAPLDPTVTQASDFGMEAMA